MIFIDCGLVEPIFFTDYISSLYTGSAASNAQLIYRQIKKYRIFGKFFSFFFRNKQESIIIIVKTT